MKSSGSEVRPKLLRAGLYAVVLVLTAPAVIGLDAKAQCSCSTPRPIHATATSAVLPMEHTEKFTAISRPRRVTIRIFIDKDVMEREGLAGKVQELADHLTKHVKSKIRGKGFKGQLDIKIVHTDTRVLIDNGFDFLGKGRGKSKKGRVVPFEIYGKRHGNRGGVNPGVFYAAVKLRAKVCVEANNSHLTLVPQTRFRGRSKLPPKANIPRHIYEQKKAKFNSKVKSEIERIRASLKRTKVRLTERQRIAIRERSVPSFDVHADFTFFKKKYRLPIRVTPLKQVRMCSGGFQ